MSVVCVINEAELLAISRMQEFTLRKKLKGLSINGILQLMRDMQIGLAAYGKKHAKMDEAQMGMLRVNATIEKIARERFYADRLGRMLREVPAHLHSPGLIQQHKQKVGVEWQALYRKFAY